MKLRHVAPEGVYRPVSEEGNSQPSGEPSSIPFPSIFPRSSGLLPSAFARPSPALPVEVSLSLALPPPLSHRILVPFGISSAFDSSHPIVIIFLSLFFLSPLSHLVAADNTPDYHVAMKYRATSGAIARVRARFIFLASVVFFIVQRRRYAPRTP